ncbi:MAG: hypothetical protein QG622_776, partial [Actinomycetota bacterium]|nr:hypothetical protein [Actinomycetota bacterium]
MTVAQGLTAALKKVVLDLEKDLRDRVESLPEFTETWRREHQAAVDRERTAMSWQEWRDDRVTQAAVAWVLTTVFVRFCEDNQLLAPVWIAGQGHRRQEALDAELAYFRANPEHTDREWLLQAIEYLGSVTATRELVESHSPLWTVSPSGQAAKKLLAFWRERTADGALVWDFSGDDLSTRFLGDLYQDLSDHAKKTFALLQTPEFVEEFILDQTLEPALAERPLEGFRLIDPTCGSGHFLLGAFTRLNDRWATHAPGLEVQARVQQALDAIHGVDLNPFAVAIARFRLMVTALQACGLTSLEVAPSFRFHLAVGDSLLHGAAQTALDLPGLVDVDASLGGFTYATEDLKALRAILEPGRYDVVVGNPPYITVKDKKLNAAYRPLYPTCKGTYALTVPFLERFFQLAKPAAGDRPAGWAGQITSNSFMKREFGSRLIEDFLSRQDLRLVVDTSGAFIPGHGTPTVILVGRPQPPQGSTVKAVLGVRGEPGQPADPAKGLVWTSIVENLGHSDFDNDYISVTDLPRKTLATHPWSLTGGGAADLRTLIDTGARSCPASFGIQIGGLVTTGEDAGYQLGVKRSAGHSILHYFRELVDGEDVHDYSIDVSGCVVFPYDESYVLMSPDSLRAELKALWPNRTTLGSRKRFGTPVSNLPNFPWFAYREIYPSRLNSAAVAVFRKIATHNIAVIDHRNRLFREACHGIVGEDLEVLRGVVSVLNSSTACFWLKQNCHSKGSQGVNEGIKAEAWERFYEFTGTTLKDFPLPGDLPLDRARSLDEAARSAAARFESLTEAVPSSEAVDEARVEIEATKARMIAEQEDLDWEVYRAYGLIDEDLTYVGDDLPGVSLGERAFEIVLAR